MDKTHIIDLLCTAVPENIALAEQLCKSQSWNIRIVIKEFGYHRFGLTKPTDFLTDTFNCFDAGLTILPKLPAKIVRLICGKNEFATLPDDLPATLEELDCCACYELTALPETLPAGLKILNCACCSLKHLPERLPAGLENLDAWGCLLETLPKNLPAGLYYLSVFSNSLKELPILPNALACLYCNGNKLISLPEKLPDSLSEFICSVNQIKSLPKELPKELAFLDVADNQISKLPAILPESLEVFICQSNLISDFSMVPKHWKGGEGYWTNHQSGQYEGDY